MDNAANALLIAGTILIALVILTVGVYLAASHSQVAESYDKSVEAKELEAFNSRFEAFRKRDNITPQEVYSLIQFCKQYKDKTGIEVKITGININTFNLATETKNQYIGQGQDVDNPANKTITYNAYTCKEDGVIYNEETGRVKEIKITKEPITKTYNNNT